MPVTSEATSRWFGDLPTGSGTTSLDSSDAAEFPVGWAARSQGESGPVSRPLAGIPITLEAGCA